MKQNAKRWLACLISLVMLISILPMSTFAEVFDYNHNGSASTDDYYNLISKKDWDNAPGISESEIVLNNDKGDYRQVIHIMKADVKNQYVQAIPTYTEMNTSKYQTSNMSEQAEWIDNNMDGTVIGTMNCCLSWYTGYPGNRVGEPLGFMMLNGEIMFDPGNCGYDYGSVGFPTCVVINKDVNESGETRPDDVPKLEMAQIRTSADLDGWEDTVIPVSSGYIVRDGVNQSSASHGDAAPRSVVGITADGQIVIMENDGRQSPFSTGMNMYECAEVMIDAGCVWAANCDGGGSSTFVSKRPGEELKVTNSPSDGCERPSTSGICFISTACADGTFTRASVSTENDFFAPNSFAQFSAVGSDDVGNAAPIPSEAIWQIDNPEMGSIDETGLFTSNGVLGDVTAQLVYDGNVVGSHTIHVVLPDYMEFNLKNIVVPNGESTELALNITYDSKPLVYNKSSISFTLSDEALGIINNGVFYATSDNTVTSGTITAAFVGTELAVTANLKLGKASEVIFDFEDNNLSNFTWYDMHGYHNQVNAYIATEENGKVHDGQYSVAINTDFSETNDWGGVQGINFSYIGPQIDLKDAVGLGAWVYVPYEDISIWYRFTLGADGNVPVSSNNAGFAGTLDESGWHYLYVDLTTYSGVNIRSGYPLLQFYLGYGSANGWDKSINTDSVWYIDNITVDYSTAVVDRELPVFGNVIFQTSDISDQGTVIPRRTVAESNDGVLTFSAEVAEDTTKSNYTGINASSAVAYIDGNQVECTYRNGKIFTSNVNLSVGVHTIKFGIEDNVGNYASVVRQINVNANENSSTIRIVPHDPSIDKALIGSLYWVDMVASDVETIDKVDVVLELNNTNDWEIQGMDVSEGFKATYTEDKVEHTLTLHIERTGDLSATGEYTIISIPLRTWWSEGWTYGNKTAEATGSKKWTPELAWSSKTLWPMDIKVDALAGNITYVDGYTSETLSGFSCAQIRVDTEIYYSRTNLDSADWSSKTRWHMHDAQPMDDKSATCTEAGYTGRTFCAECNSVVDWGTTIPALGHDWQVNAEGKLACANGGELFNGVYTDGKTYVDGVVIGDGWNADNTSYYIDGVKVTGSIVIDKVVYTFDENGTYLPDYIYNGFINSNDGVMYFYSNESFENEYLYINNTAYYFVNGIARDGEYTISGETCVFENGAYVSCSTAEVVSAGWQGTAVTYIIYKDGRMVLGGEGETYKYTSRAKLPWYSIRTVIRTITIGKDITSLGHYALADIYYANSITFEEGSKLKYIGAGTFLSIYNITEIRLPDSLETIVQNSFKMCKNLANVYMPQNLKYVHERAFVNNSNVVMEKIILNVAEGTYAETYAKNNNIPYTVRPFEEKVLANGTCGENATWTLYESGKMVIGGNGAMENYANQDAQPWAEYRMQIKDIVIGKDITAVGNYAFAYAHNVKSVTFENGSKLEKIGAAGFLYMLYVTEVEIPGTVKNIGNLAFAYCGRLNKVVLPQNVSLIYVRSFYKCPNVVLNVAEGTYALQYAQTNGISYETRAFEDEVLANGTCGANATWTLYASGKMVIGGSGAMENYANQDAQPWVEYRMQIKNIVIGKDITVVGNYAFAYAHNVESVTFEEGSKLERIGAAGFLYMLYVTEVDIPDSVTYVGSLAFGYCRRLATVSMPTGASVHVKAFYKSPYGD